MFETFSNSELVHYGILFAVLFIGLLVLMIIMKLVVGARVRNTRIDADFGDLTKMRDTGLMTPEEYDKVKKRIAERMLNAQFKPATKPKGELSLQALAAEIEQRRLAGLPLVDAQRQTTAEQQRSNALNEQAPPVQPSTTAPPPTSTPEKATFDLPSSPAAPIPACDPKILAQLQELKKLLADGVIDQTEYARLRAYYEKKMPE